jgi:secondary thiamine-phosphate synthase enzyme
LRVCDIPAAADIASEPMLRQDLRRLTIPTTGEGFIDLTSALNREIGASGIATGQALISCLHTSCSLTVNENADPRVLQDLAAYLQALVPQEGVRPISGQGPLRAYVHDDEGWDDMPAHIRTALTCTSLSLSVERSRLVLGTWQAVYLWEHRTHPHRRQLCLHLIGEG